MEFVYNVEFGAYCVKQNEKAWITVEECFTIFLDM
jgi:hypothetical protein